MCEIKPISYDLQSVFQLMKSLKLEGNKAYAIESLWKFLLVSEVAHAALESIERRPDLACSGDEKELIRFVGRNKTILARDFSARLDACLARLTSEQVVNASETLGSGRVERFHQVVSEAIHGGIYRDLRLALGKVLSENRRVAIIIDNLDKAWDRKSDLASASEFLLGILSAANRVKTDFSRSDSRRDNVAVNVTIFLRSDIFDKVKAAAREPDKINTAKITWNDQEILFRVIEERFAALHEGNLPPEELWRRYVCGAVRTKSSRDYFPSRTLPRPRDLVFFVKAALATAINRRHVQIEEKDILEAEKQYSQFAVESILVEDDGSYGSLEEIVYEFAAVSPQLTRTEVEQALARAGVEAERFEKAILYLCGLTFLGIEVAVDDFRFADDPQTNAHNAILARRRGEQQGRPPRYKIHPAFWAFLELEAISKLI